MDNDVEIYKNKKFSDLCKDIISNSESNRDQLDILMSDLRILIKTANDALLIVPLIKEYFDVRVRNDEQLVKLASVIQKIITRQTMNPEGSDGFVISEAEKRQIMQEVENISIQSQKLIKVKNDK